MKKSHKKGIPILSFYSGGGFLDMGFESAGFEIVWTNEIDATFATFHEAGITSWRKSRGNGIEAEIFNKNSIAKIDPDDIIREAFKGHAPQRFGIIGGPPCQDFSINGSRKGFRGSRGRLTRLFIDKIVDLKPTFFVMENVKGLLKHETHLMKLLQGVKADYDFDYKTLNAIDFGVPQFRERVFFIGIRKSTRPKEGKYRPRLPKNWFTWPLNNTYNGAFNRFDWPSASKFGGKIKRPEGVPLKLCVKKCLVPDSQFKSVPNADEFFNLYGKARRKQIKEGETNRPSFKRLHRFKYSPTACYGNNEVHLHPYKNRRISVREALRIQGVSDRYILPSDGELLLTKKFKMIGNGVPVPLAKAVAASVYKCLETRERLIKKKKA